jgi:hypothetical protein
MWSYPRRTCYLHVHQPAPNTTASVPHSCIPGDSSSISSEGQAHLQANFGETVLQTYSRTLVQAYFPTQFSAIREAHVSSFLEVRKLKFDFVIIPLPPPPFSTTFRPFLIALHPHRQTHISSDGETNSKAYSRTHYIYANEEGRNEQAVCGANSRRTDVEADASAGRAHSIACPDRTAGWGAGRWRDCWDSHWHCRACLGRLLDVHQTRVEGSEWRRKEHTPKGPRRRNSQPHDLRNWWEGQHRCRDIQSYGCWERYQWQFRTEPVAIRAPKRASKINNQLCNHSDMCGGGRGGG